MNKRGFTLIETVFALIIFAGGILLLGNSWSGNLARVRKIKQSAEISSLLERKIAEFEIEYKDNPGGIPEKDEGNFGDQYPNYSWILESKALEFPDLSGTLTARKGGADQQLITMIKTMGDFIKKSIKEVTVTLVAKFGSKEYKYPITTYLVDYNQEIAVPGMPVGMPGATDTGGGKQGGGSSSK
jgi:prepilin-type N-terminal cleavage/methylation domain-containing protein